MPKHNANLVPCTFPPLQHTKMCQNSQYVGGQMTKTPSSFQKHTYLSFSSRVAMMVVDAAVE